MCTHAHTRARTHAHALPGLRAQQPFSVSLLGRVPLRFRASARSRAPLPLQSQSAAPVAQLRAPREAGARARSALGPHPAASWHTRRDELIIGSFADDVEGGGRTSGTYPRIRRSERRWPGQRLRAAYTLPFGAGAPQGGLSDELRSAQWTLTQSCLCLCTSSPGAAAAGHPPLHSQHGSSPWQRRSCSLRALPAPLQPRIHPGAPQLPGQGAAARFTDVRGPAQGHTIRKPPGQTHCLPSDPGPTHTRVHAHRYTHTDIHTDTDTHRLHIHTHADIHTQTCAHTCTHTRRGPERHA